MNAQFSALFEQINQSYCSKVPPIKNTHEFIGKIVRLLFPIMENRSISTHELESEFTQLQLHLKELLLPLDQIEDGDIDAIAERFFEQIPDIYEMLVEDAQTILASDPAANCLEEVVVSYPGFYALTIHRLAHLLYLEKVPHLPRVMSEYAHGRTGIDIHPGASIGKKFCIDHGTGIVIGETVIIGNNVKIYQGVTLGATFVAKRLKDTKRHPTIEDNVIMYAGCSILGKDTIIGHDTTIGGNVWLTESVPSHSFVYSQQQSVVRDNRDISRASGKD